MKNNLIQANLDWAKIFALSYFEQNKKIAENGAEFKLNPDCRKYTVQFSGDTKMFVTPLDGNKKLFLHTAEFNLFTEDETGELVWRSDKTLAGTDIKEIRMNKIMSPKNFYFILECLNVPKTRLRFAFLPYIINRVMV